MSLSSNSLTSQFLHSYTSLVLVPVLLVVRFLYNKYATPLRKFPGPFWATGTRLWQVSTARSGEAEKHYIDVHKKYGPVVRIGPNEVSFSSPNAALDLFRVGKGFRKTPFYVSFLPPHIHDIFTEIRENEHAMIKRFAVPAYSLASVQQHTSGIEALLRKFFIKVDGLIASGQPLDIGTWVHYLAFDVLGQFAFATEFGFVEQGTDIDGAIKGVMNHMQNSCQIGMMPVVDWLFRLNPIWKFIPEPLVPKNKLLVFTDAATGILQQYQDPEGDKDHKQSLLKTLYGSHVKSPDKFTMDNIMAISIGAVGAGSDSTASTMHTTIWHVLANPSIHEKLVASILDAPFSHGIIQYKDALELPYFQACLKEAMRLQPGVGFNMQRSVPVGGASVDGTWLPGGTLVAVNGWVIHRDEGVFGAKPDQYRPERWLDASPEQLVLMERSMVQFGGGSHLCIGRHLALFEMNKILPELFCRYEMELVEPKKPLSHTTGFFYIQNGLNVRMKLRTGAQSL